MSFKVGDRVTWSEAPQYGVGTVVPDTEGYNCGPKYLSVRFDDFDAYDDSDGVRDCHSPAVRDLTLVSEADAVEHPGHYNSHPSGIEAIEITRHETFLRGNILKYVLRAPYKGSELEDLKKAATYLQWEIERVEGLNAVERD